jgi:iron complex transport system ATP-binding protein
MIEINGVTHHIAGTRILDDISLQLKPGGVVALVGPNGAGKSTLLSLVARLQALQTGSVRVNGLQVGQVADDQLARELAILPQELSVSSRLTVRDLAGFGRYPYHKGRAGREDEILIDRALAAFDLGALSDRPLETLSGGQRQRAFLAMAYAQDTQYLLLDEPLNNLDIAASRLLMQRLRDLAGQQGRTVVIVLHDINYAAAYADRIVALKAGRVVADGAPSDIVTEAMLADVFETNASVGQINGRPVVLV